MPKPYALWTELRWLLCIMSRAHVHPDLIASIERFEKIFIFGGTAQKTAMQNLASLHGPELIHIKTFPAGENKHVIDFQREQLQALGYDTSMKIPRLFLRAEDFAAAQNILYPAKP